MVTHPVIYDLEKQRISLRNKQFSLQDAFDFLDHGSPTIQQKKETWATIETLKNEINHTEMILENTIRHIIRARPKLIREWVNKHILFYQTLLLEMEEEVPCNTTQIEIARQTIQNWQDVLTGQRLYVIENAYLITQYQTRQKIFFGLQEEPNPN